MSKIYKTNMMKLKGKDRAFESLAKYEIATRQNK